MRLDRRRFLSLSSAALGGLASASLFRPRASKAGTPAFKRRVLFIYAEGGWTAPDIMMRPPGAPPEWSTYNPWNASDFGVVPDDLEWEFPLDDPALTEDRFSRVLRPLYRHRDQMVVTEGLARLSDALDPYGDAHAKGHIACMSATASAYEYDGVKSQGATPSMDQRIHDFLRIDEPHLQSLDFRPRPNRSNGDLFHEYLYRSNGMGGADRLPTQANPDQAFQFLFDDEPVEPSPFDDAQDAMLSMSLEQFDRLTPRLSAEDRIKLEAHRDMLHQLRLGLATPFDCGTVPPPTPVDGLSRAAQYEADFESFARMIGAAFACGVARVATLGLVTIPPEAYGLPESASIHHEYEHESSPFDGFAQSTPFEGTYAGASTTWINAYEGMVQRNIWQAEQVAKVIDIMREIPDEDGTLLDNTLVVYVSELSHGSHGTEHYPIILFGGFAGAVTPGRYIKYAQNKPNPWNRNYFNEWTGTPHSHLFVSILQAFGMDVDYLEAPSVQGYVPHLNIEETVSLSGPLPRLV